MRVDLALRLKRLCVALHVQFPWFHDHSLRWLQPLNFDWSMTCHEWLFLSHTHRYLDAAQGTILRGCGVAAEAFAENKAPIIVGVVKSHHWLQITHDRGELFAVQ
jgi:hypothetical protein